PRYARTVEELSRLCGRGVARDSYWPSLIRISASLAETGYSVADRQRAHLRWWACCSTGLLRCVCAAANSGGHPPQVVAPAPGDHGRAALSACPAPQQPRSKQCLPIEVAVMSTARTS